MNRLGNCWPTPEQTLLLHAALDEPDQAKQAWYQYCQRVDLQTADYVSSTLWPLVFRHLEHHSVAGPEWSTVKSVYRHTWGVNHTQLFQVIKVLRLLQQEGVSITLLKGSAMIACCYQDAGVRVMSDLDVLMPRAQLPSILRILKEQQWTAPETDAEILQSHSHAIGVKRAEGGHLDVHWQVLVGSGLDPLFAAYQPRLRPLSMPLFQMQVNVLAPEDQLLHTLMHGLRGHPEPMIRWIVDSVTVLRHHPEFDWHYYWAQADRLKVEWVMVLGLRFLQEQGWLMAPQWVMDKLETYQPERWEIRYARFMALQDGRDHVLKLLWHCHLHSSHANHVIWAALTFPWYAYQQKGLRKIGKLPQILWRLVRAD